MVYTKVVGLNQIYNFVVEIFSVEVVLAPKYMVSVLNFKFSKFSNDLIWENSIYESCRPDQIYNL